MLNKFKNNIFIIFILVIGLFLAVKNYTPGTFLSGWDALHPEFNFGLSFERAMSGVFREEQGLGAVAAHSHMADLPHLVILYLLRFIFPLSDLRYLYIFLNLILGPVGMYFFLNKYIVKNKIGSFLGSLFYLLNLGTMQQFVVPFEMFTTQYALLPWLFLFANNYLFAKEKSKNKLLFFLTVTLFATPMAYAATLWYVYFLVLILYALSLSIFTRSLLIFKKSLILIALTLAINSFWIFPNIYFVLNHGKEVTGALINQLFSNQAFLYNKEFGNIKDIALLKNFLFDWNAYSGNSNFFPLLLPWINHLNQRFIQLIGYFLALIAVAGVFYGVFKKNKILISLTLPLLFCIFFLINDNPPTSLLYNFLQNKIPLFEEAFRFPGDKVLGIITFLFAVYFAKGQEIILKRFKNAQFVYLLICLFAIFYYMLPAFKGNFISPYMRVEIPKSYFETFNWFNSQPSDARIAELPINSLWGWKYYKWYDNKPSFQGADFLQFGIPQSLLDRDFDRWSPYNEQYYREMSEAIYSQNSIKLENVLKKYDIGYILLDKSIIAPEQKMNSQVLFFNETENLLTNSLILQQVFHSGNLFVYQVNPLSQKVRIIKNPLPIGPASSVFYDDFVYSKYNDYITYVDPKKNNINYPFRNIIDNQNRILPGAAVPDPQLIGKQYNVIPSTNSINDCPLSMSGRPRATMKITEGTSGKFLRYSTSAGPLCNHYSLVDIPRNQAYLISITSRNILGLPLEFCITNYVSRRCDIFTRLSPFSTFKEEVFLLPPMGEGVGIDVNINNFAIKKSPSINDLKSIKITPFSYAEISQIEQYNPISNYNDIGFIVYSQSFEKGWKAYEITNDKWPASPKLQRSEQIVNWAKENLPFFFGKELKEHVLVNNWANGWMLPGSKFKVQSSKYVVIFWPQYLEYLGFAILIITFAWLFLLSFRKNIAKAVCPRKYPTLTSF